MRLFTNEGRIRFQGNALVQALLEGAQARGFTLNDLANMEFRQSEWEEFYQLIGYSLDGYHELSRVSDFSALSATKAAREQYPEAEGCRDTGCPLHCGVPLERAR